jgi:hypothetical protein
MLYAHTSRTIAEACGLTEAPKVAPRKYKNGLLSAISAGFFLVLVGMLFVTVSNLPSEIVGLFNDFKIDTRVPHTEIFLPAPVHISAHSIVYSAVQQFSLVWAVFLVGMLVARFVVGSPLRKKGENVSDIVFWFGTAYLIQTLLLGSTRVADWFAFWAAIIILAGASLIARAAFLAAFRKGQA